MCSARRAFLGVSCEDIGRAAVNARGRKIGLGVSRVSRQFGLGMAGRGWSCVRPAKGGERHHAGRGDGSSAASDGSGAAMHQAEQADKPQTVHENRKWIVGRVWSCVLHPPGLRTAPSTPSPVWRQSAHADGRGHRVGEYCLGLLQAMHPRRGGAYVHVCRGVCRTRQAV